MNRWGPRYPKSLLHEFYQVHGGTPTFQVDSAEGSGQMQPVFTCRLTIPAVCTQFGGFEEHLTSATARSKKAAEHAAAEKALEFIADRGLLQPPVQGITTTPSLGSNDSGILPVMDEVRQLRQHIQDLTSQLSASQEPMLVLPPHEIPLDTEMGKIVGNIEPADAEVTLDELRIALKEAHEANMRLRQELRTEQGRRHAAFKALMGNKE